MDKIKNKLIAIITAWIFFITGCKLDLNNFINRDKINEPTTKKEESSMTTEPSEEKTIILETTESLIEPEITEENIMTEPTESLIETEIPEETTDVSENTETQQETIDIPQIELEPSNKDELLIATTNVNIRSSNTTDSLIIGELKIYETAYRILSCDNNWDLIRHDEGIGYVCSDYLEETDNYIESEYKHKEYNDIVLTKTDLNFRKEPNTEGEIIRTFRINTELQVIAKVDNGWLLVNYNGTIGYVHGDHTISLLEKAKQQYPELNLEELDIQNVVYVDASDLNIRKGPSTEYERDGNLVRLESARVLKEIDDWYFIMTNEYTFGFINKNYTKTLEGIFVVVDLSVQRLYLYNNNVLYYVTPVTTGKDSTPSDIGLFKIYYKATNVTLTDNKTYWSPVEYWIAYNGGEGIHDADWRSVFGTESYKYAGSHGCINTPPEIADNIYENVSLGTKVLVHK